MIAPSALLRNGSHCACEPLRGPQRASISSRGGTRRDVRYGGTQLWFLPWAVLQRGGAARTELLRGCPVCPRRQVPSTEVLYCLSRCQHGWQPRQGATGNAVGEVTHVALGTERSPKPQPSSLPSLTVRGGWSHPVFWCPASRLHVSTMSRGEDLHLGQAVEQPGERRPAGVCRMLPTDGEGSPHAPARAASGMYLVSFRNSHLRGIAWTSGSPAVNPCFLPEGDI
ncbi:uncharacterized protein LOC142361388 isoform X2 [Opisthocomus hoazin]|uniref:uncharacterized protein LOC142361388 isoform X2 n=1 Tax=Opisthocomus hoazin TaxID=30419 RepID=UPI003F53D6CA